MSLQQQIDDAVMKWKFFALTGKYDEATKYQDLYMKLVLEKIENEKN